MRYSSALDLSGQTAVVTGGASGIGLESARALGQCGAAVELVDSSSEALFAAAGTLAGEGIRVETSVVDVTDPKQVNAAAERIHERAGRIHTLLNSAGIAQLHTAVDVSDEDWRRVMDVNVNGTFWCCRTFGARMIEAGGGSIVNMGSMSGTIVNRPQFAASYMASKGAIHQLTKALAVEWAKSGVRVNALAPGYVATEMTLAMRARPELFNTWLDMTPMGRLAEPREIASLVVFLASAASSYMTGSIIAIDGGYTSI